MISVPLLFDALYISSRGRPGLASLPTPLQYLESFFDAVSEDFLSFFEVGVELVQAVVDVEEDLFAVFGDKERLDLGGVGAVVFGRVEADRAGRKVGAFIAAVEGLFLTAFNVRADAALADRGEGTAVVVGPAGAAPLPEEAVVARKPAVRDRVQAFAGGGDEGDLDFFATLDPGAVVAVLGIKSVALQRFAGEILTVAAEGLAPGDRALGDVTMSVKGFAFRCDASAATAGFFKRASVAVESAIRSDFRFLHAIFLFRVVLASARSVFVRLFFAGIPR